MNPKTALGPRLYGSCFDDLIITEKLNRYVHIAYFRVSHAYISNLPSVFAIIVLLTPTIPEGLIKHVSKYKCNPF